MSDRIQISIEARENASRVFGQVGDAASKMGQDVNDAADLFQALTTQYGMTADAARDVVAAQGLSTAALDRTGAAAAATTADMRALGTSADTVAPAMRDAATATTEAGTAATTAGSAAASSGASWRTLQNDLLNIGAAAGVAVAGFSLVGQAARDHEIAVRTIGATYGENADAMVAFADEIQRTTNFSNDAALESANIAATLGRNYGFTFQEIQQVLTISADLAATTGRTLEDATQRVVAAMRGEAESAEMLGLTLNQAAIDHDNVTLSMSNQEAGHFRLNALIEQSSFAMGEAATQADTTYGSLTNLKDSVQDNVVAFGEMLGPVGEVGAFLADNALQSVLAGAGLAQLARGAASARTAMVALAATHTSVALLASAIGPIGLVAAAGLAGIAIYKFAESIDGVMVTAVDVAEEKIGDLEQTMRDLYATGNTLGEIAERGTELFPGLAEGTAEMEQLIENITQTNRAMGQMSEEARALAEEDIARWQDRLIDLAQQFGSLDENMLATTLSTNDVAAATDALNSILRNMSEGAADQQAAAVGLIDAYDQGKISAQELVDTLILLGASTDQYDAAATRAIGSTEAVASATESANEQLRIASVNWNMLSVEAAKLLAPYEQLAIAADNWNIASVESARAQAQLSPGMTQFIVNQQNAAIATAAANDQLAIAADNWNMLSVEAARATSTTQAGYDQLAIAAQSFSDISVEAARAQAQMQPGVLQFWLNQQQAIADTEAAIEAANAQLEIFADNYNMMSVEAARFQGNQEAGRRQLELTADAWTAVSVEAARAQAAMSPGEIDIALTEAAAAQAEVLQGQLAAALDAVTASYMATTDAVDNAFRVIVGNTNAIANQSQAVADWATELIDVEGTYSALDDLLANHSITLQQYTDAQRAHNTIQADNAMIQNDILSIQAQSAPVLASLMASQARYVNELANAEAPAQALALAYMDTATSARALELAQIAASEAPGFEGLIQGAIAANPYIEAILTDMGVISRGAEGELIINTEGETEVEALTTAIESLEDTIVSVFVEVDDSELENIGAAQGFPMGGDFGQSPARTINFLVTADTSDADAKIDATSGKLAEWDGASATAQVLADNADAVAKIDTAGDKMSGWDGSTGTADVNANDNASGTISSVSSALSALDGRTATTYINTVYTTTYQTVGSPGGMFFGLGGVAGYADGGVVARMAENGPEMLHFPMGGVAVAPSPGIYAVPRGTYVDTAPATAHKLNSMGGAFTFINQGTIIGVPDLERQITRTISEGLRRANQIHRSSFA